MVIQFLNAEVLAFFRVISYHSVVLYNLLLKLALNFELILFKVG